MKSLIQQVLDRVPYCLFIPKKEPRGDSFLNTPITCTTVGRRQVDFNEFARTHGVSSAYVKHK